jgi:hypothetical protein
MNWESQFRLLWIVRLLGAGLLSGMLLSWKLWITNRLYPLFPVWNWIPQFNHPLDIIFVLLFFGCVTWMIYKPSRLSIAIVLSSILMLALQDQSRWQPWFYQYGLMLVPYLFFPELGHLEQTPSDTDHAQGASKKSRKKRRRSLNQTGEVASVALGIQQMIIIMVYIWGGIHKCQAGWMSVWENSLIKPLLESWGNEGIGAALLAFGYGVPVFEILTGLGLLFKRTRHIAILCALLTHLTILALLGPVKGTISNSVVWPWNFVMMVLVVIAFYKHERFSIAGINNSRLRIPGMVIGALLTIAPILFYFGLWDRYLSFSLYAGQQKRVLIRVDPKAIEHVPEELVQYLFDPKAPDGHRILSASGWSMGELNVPFVSEWKIIRSLTEWFCENDKLSPGLVVFVDHQHMPDVPRRYFRCNQIEEMGRDN